MSYTATVTRSGKYWAIEVEGLGWTQARNLREVDAMTRDLIAAHLDQDTYAGELEVHYVVPDEAAKHLEHSKQLFQEASTRQRLAAEEVREAARILVGDGIPQRDVGILLGVSHQRVHQLVS